MGFIQNTSGPVAQNEGFVQITLSVHKSNTFINITAVDKLHLNCDCIIGSNVKGDQQTILYSFGLDKPAGHKIYKEPGTEPF